jgi:hypothetical protein
MDCIPFFIRKKMERNPFFLKHRTFADVARYSTPVTDHPPLHHLKLPQTAGSHIP